MVAGLYQPLADGDLPIARHATRPNLSPAVVSEDKEQRTPGIRCSSASPKNDRRFARPGPLLPVGSAGHEAKRIAGYYLTSTLAPASSSFFLAASASALLMP